MNERRRPPRRGRGQRPQDRPAAELAGEPNPYRDEPIEGADVDTPTPSTARDDQPAVPRAVTVVDSDRPQKVETSSSADGPPPVDSRDTEPAPRTANEDGGERSESPRPDLHQGS